MTGRQAAAGGTSWRQINPRTCIRSLFAFRGTQKNSGRQQQHPPSNSLHFPFISPPLSFLNFHASFAALFIM